MADSNDNSSFTGGPMIAVVIAVVILVGVAVAVFAFNPHKMADFTVAKVDLFTPHTEFKSMPGAMHVVGQAPDAEDDLYVVAHVRFTVDQRLPLFLTDWTGLVKLADGTTVDATTVPAQELPRLEQIFPALAPLVTQPLKFGEEVAPRTTREGTIILLFPNTTESAWRTRQTAIITIDLHDEPSQTAKIP
ncbi:MAG TPA: hypothetical protein VIJ65_01430 [Acidobacteriaceae bacterium]